MLKGWWGKKATVPPTPEGSAEVARPTPAGSAGRSEEDERLLDRIAQGVVRWEMTVPAIFLLESSKPLNFVGSQFLHFLSPIIHTLVDAKELDRFAVMLEKRDTVEELIVRIERADQERPKPVKRRRGNDVRT
ncbi:MAG TPA: hypothetical protein VFR10_07730 [bacterium]|nr:hypothetical protein [bacterium]